jgi:type IV pilus assembly protein PilC
MRAMVERAEAELDRELRISQRSHKLALLSHHLAVLLSAGVPLAQSLEALCEQTEDPTLAQALESITRRVMNGHRLSHALTYFPGIFPPIFSGLVAVGENTGALVEAIARLSEVLEKEDKLNQKLSSALSYPVFILALTGGLTMVMFRFVLPTFVELFNGVGGTLPLPTQIVLGITKLVGTLWFWLVAAALVYGTQRLLRELWAQPERRLVMFRLMLAVPLAGDMLKYATLARFCWVMQLTLRTGLDLMRCLQLAAGASNSPLLVHDLPRAQATVRAGETLSDHLGHHPKIYPNLLRQFVKLGEEATEFSSAFGHAAAWFEEEVEVRIEMFKAALEPILMVTVALVVGGIVLSIFLPLYGLLDKLA